MSATRQLTDKALCWAEVINASGHTITVEGRRGNGKIVNAWCNGDTLTIVATSSYSGATAHKGDRPATVVFETIMIQLDMTQVKPHSHEGGIGFTVCKLGYVTVKKKETA